jgi:peptidoglycan hydrolase CwlO-like protein
MEALSPTKAKNMSSEKDRITQEIEELESKIKELTSEREEKVRERDEKQQQTEALNEVATKHAELSRLPAGEE